MDRLGASLVHAADLVPGKALRAAQDAVESLAARFADATQSSQHPDVVGTLTRLRHASHTLAEAINDGHQVVDGLARYAGHIGTPAVTRTLPGPAPVAVPTASGPGTATADTALGKPAADAATPPGPATAPVLAVGAEPTAAPAEPKVHPRVPPYDGGKVVGVLKVGDAEHDLVSGEDGPGRWLVDNLAGGPGSGLTRAWTHVEGHAAGHMREHGVASAELFISKVPCGTGAAKCRYVLHKLLPPGSVLDVHFRTEDGGVGTWRFVGGVKGWSER